MGKKQRRRQLAKERFLSSDQSSSPSSLAAHELTADKTAGQSHQEREHYSSPTSSFSSHHSRFPGLGMLESIYDKHYKKLLVFPMLLLLLAFVQIGLQTAATGDFIHKGVSLKGGITVTVPTMEGDVVVLEEKLLQQFPGQDIGVRALTSNGALSGFTIETDLPRVADETYQDRFVSAIEDILHVERKSFSIEAIGSSLGENFFRQTIQTLYAAFLFMGMVVFLYFGIGTKYKVASVLLTLIAAFLTLSNTGVIGKAASYVIGAALLWMYIKTSIPSIAVIIAAFSDIVITIAIVNLLGVKISTAGIAAFLMLIGYSVDTDILLSTRVLKRKSGTVLDGVYSAIKPGLTMTFTTIVAVTVGLIFSKSEVLTQIMLIILIGLFVDLVNTWIQNVGIIRWYFEKQG
ncbi:hypothetical protein HYS47_01525 [Candidatus Woesearchaeota archaeon]|nr:hypothetical protein [Candidatus Woesearchaeota archaeon]